MAARDELKDLLSEQTVTVALCDGREQSVTVRGYTALEYFEVKALAQPVLDALAALELDAAEDTEALWDESWAVLGEHGAVMRQLVAAALDAPLDLADVTAVSFQRLLYTVLDVNHPFFIAVMEERRTMLTMALQMLRQLGTLESSPSSSPPASARAH